MEPLEQMKHLRVRPLSSSSCPKQATCEVSFGIAPSNADTSPFHHVLLILLVVSKAFTVLSDPQKRAIFDQHGPDEGKSSGVNYDRASPAGHHHHRGGFTYTHGGYGEEISPEDLFNMFFGGGGCMYSVEFLFLPLGSIVYLGCDL